MDLFSNIFTNKILGNAFQSAFGKDGQQPQMYGSSFSYNPLRTSGLEMPMYESSPAGQTTNIATADFETIGAMWDRRLFGNDSYTNITLPRLS